MFWKFKKKEIEPLTLMIYKIEGDFVLAEFNRTLTLSEVLKCYVEFRSFGIEVVHPLIGHRVVLDIKNYDGSRGRIREKEWFN